MQRKHFDYKTKIEYAKRCNQVGLLDATIEFLYEFEDRYLDTWLGAPKGKSKSKNPANHAKARILIWTNKYNLLGEAGLINMTGKNSPGRPKKTSINELNKHDRELYQEIMEEILRDHGINPNVIQDKIKDKKKKGKSFDNYAKACSTFGINRTSIYKKIGPKNVISKTSLEMNKVEGLTDWMSEQIAKSNNVIGRDKLFHHYKNTVNNTISSYVWRLHWESLGYKSNAYVRRNTNNPPKEKKYKGVYCADVVNGEFKSRFSNEKWFADISYVKVKNQWFYLHVITESFSNSVVAWSLTKDRTSKATIALLESAYIKTGVWPKVFHTDHGIEYANQYTTEFLNSKGITQSMSPKGNSLANRPSEFLFGLIKRERLYQYDFSGSSSTDVETHIKEYLNWYHNDRPQSCLENKTPHSYLMNAEKNNMCLLFVS